MTDKNELLIQHYYKAIELTTPLWNQRNRLFLILLAVIGISTVLTYQSEDTNGLFVDWVASVLEIDDQDRVKDLRMSFPFILLHTILLAFVFYLMFNLYHRSLSVLMQYAYIGALEKEIRDGLRLKEPSVAFTKESTFYWDRRPKLLKSVKWVYFLILGLLLFAFLGGRLLDDLSNGSPFQIFLDFLIGIPTIIYFMGYAIASVRLDRKDAIIPARAKTVPQKGAPANQANAPDQKA